MVYYILHAYLKPVNIMYQSQGKSDEGNIQRIKAGLWKEVWKANLSCKFIGEKFWWRTKILWIEMIIGSLTEILYGHSLNFLTVVGNTDINQTFKKFTLHSVKKVRNYSQMKNVSSSLFTLWLINGKVDFTKFLGKHDESKILQFSHCALWKL